MSAEEVFGREFGDAPHAFWVDGWRDGQSTLLGSADRVATYRVGDGVRIDGELVEADLWRWLGSLEGTWVGFLGYGVKAVTRGGRPHPRVSQASDALPDAIWMRADRLIELPASCNRLFDQLPAPSNVHPVGRTPGYMSSRSREEYVADIATIREHLARGESYEVCLTRSISLKPIEDPLALHLAMREVSPTGRSVYLRCGDLAICSATPEEFLTVTPGGTVRARPIKGTAPRHDDPVADARAAANLATDPKTRAENLMIADLLRNDLNQVCEPGSVEVPEFLSVETYATVHQLVSTVTGTLAHGRIPVDAVRAAFPPGSMTGAPKERTMRIIDTLEPEPRGVYSGAIGVLGGDGSIDLRVVIRTAVCTPASVTIGTGGAITWLSDAEAEWEETELKARAVLAAVARVRKNGSHG